MTIGQKVAQGAARTTVRCAFGDSNRERRPFALPFVLFSPVAQIERYRSTTPPDNTGSGQTGHMIRILAGTS